jgi:hypothetical protein
MLILNLILKQYKIYHQTNRNKNRNRNKINKTNKINKNNNKIITIPKRYNQIFKNKLVEILVYVEVVNQKNNNKNIRKSYLLFKQINKNNKIKLTIYLELI